MKKKISVCLIAILVVFSVFLGANMTEKAYAEEATNDVVVLTYANDVSLLNDTIEVEYLSLDDAALTITIPKYDYFQSELFGQKVYSANVTDNSVHNADGTGGRLASKRAFIYIILRVDKKITGYAVIVIDEVELETSHRFQTRLLRSALFPEVDGKPQKVKTKHVKKIMKKIKNEEVNK